MSKGENDFPFVREIIKYIKTQTKNDIYVGTNL